MIVRSLADPTGQDSLTVAIGWVEGTVVGTLAMIIAILAVAGVGFAMLSGRIEARRGITVVLGCYVLFGASMIARGMFGTTFRTSETQPVEVAQPTFPIPRAQPMPQPAPRPSDHDPYAGASVPR